MIRKLRLGHSLKRCGEGFVLDLTSQRSHKTSKVNPFPLVSTLRIANSPLVSQFYGPSCTTMSPLLTEALNLYLTNLQFDAIEDDSPYLFHPQGDTRRCVGSSQWSAMVKASFLKHSGIACPPKLLRSSFITWLKDTVDESPNASEVLKSAAKAMRHKEETQGSDKYDKKTHDRLTAAATQYVEAFARQFSPAAIPDGWCLVEGQPPSFEFSKGEKGFVCSIEWFDSLQPDSVYRFATFPGRTDGFSWKTPAAMANVISVTVESTMVAKSFVVTHLLCKATQPPALPELAPTEIVETPIIVDDDDEWQCIEGDFAAMRDGDRFLVALPSHPLLVAGAEVRFLRAEKADLV